MVDKKKLFEPISNNNIDSSKIIFETRKFYEIRSLPYLENEHFYSVQQLNDPLIPRFIIPSSDFYKQKKMYGCLDLEHNIIEPSTSESYYEKVSSTNNIYLLDFVADAFKQMREELNNQILKGCFNGRTSIANSSKFYNISIVESYDFNTNNDALYTAGAVLASSIFKEYCKVFKEINSSIVDFRSFILQFINFIIKENINVPLTKSANLIFYNKRKFNDGISFKIANEPAGNDDVAYLKYYLDVGFLNFSDLCSKYGFIINKHYPFIIYADLSSKPILDYASKRINNFTGINDIFKKYYTNVYSSDVAELELFFISAYKFFLINNLDYSPSKKDMLICDLLNLKSDMQNTGSENQSKSIAFFSFKKRLQYSSDQRLPTQFWVRFYLFLKNKELNMGLTQPIFEAIVRKATTLKLLHEESFNEYIGNLIRPFLIQQDNDKENSGLRPQIIF